MKPLYMKTYGKQSRKISAWVSPPRDRKKAFESTLETEGDGSVFEPAAKPAKIRKTTAARSRAARPGKKKALPCRTERSSDEENIPSPSCPQQSKTSREKKPSVCSRVLRPVKRKAILCLTETSSDEEDISRPSPPRSLPAQQSKKTRNSRLVSEPAVMMTEKCQQVPVTGESVEEPTNGHKNSVQMKTDSSFHPPSASRFVTRRRCTVVNNKATLSTLNSSDDFAAGPFGSSRLFRPSRKRRRGPPAFLPLSAESSVNAAGTGSFATTTVPPFQEISLNEWADQGLAPRSRKPIFCSTPSAGPYSQRQRLKPLSSHDSSASPPSMSVSCIGVVSTFQDDPDSPPPQPSAPTIVPHSGEKPQSSFGEQEPDLHHHKGPSSDVFTERNISSGSGEEAKSLIEEAKNVMVLPSLILLSSDESECSGSFVSAAGGLQWLVEALTEQCLTQRCTVQLERLDPVTVTQQLCSQSPYSSCLEHSSSVHSWQTKEHTPTVDLSQSSEVEPSLNLRLSVTNNLTSAFLQSVNGLKSPERAASETDGQSIDNASSLDLNQTASALIVESEAVNDTSLTKNVTVQLGEDHTQSGSTDDQEDLTCSGRKIMPPFETEALTAKLKENCLTDELHVKVKRVTASQLKGILKGKASTDVSDSASDEQTNQQPPESDINGRRHKDTSSAAKVKRKKRRSTSSEDKMASDKEPVVKNVPHTRKKTSLAPKEKKRRSTSADRPGTTRKACVSGLSVSRWKGKDAASTHVFRSNMAGDCSINDLISTQRQQPQELLGSTMNFCTPVRTGRLNLSSLLTDLTPNNTHTWSRLKAALSVHRRGMVLQTPKGSRLSGSGSPGRVELADASQDLFATSFRTPLRKRFRSQLLSNDSLEPCEEADLSDAEKVYAECDQQRPLAWEDCILPERMKACVKIGEGTFGEVFSTTNVSGDTVALKIIPLEGREKVNGEDQKTLGEILHEIIISKELSSLKEKQKNQTHGFIGLNDLHCVQGCYPPDFLKAWDTFDQKKGSENDRPDFFEKDQLFIILEFEFGGSDLENSNGALASLRVAKSILHQVTAAMAVAEQELHFEHRDLHWGNVLVKPTKQKTARFLLNGAAHSLESKGVLVRIIDYSLSRLEIDGLTVSCDISQDEELFMGQGDYQFDIYRLMRQENGNNWGDYRPHSNVLWLHYLCSKLLSMKYRGSGGKGAKDTREELTGFCDNLLQYSSATETLQKSPMFH